MYSFLQFIQKSKFLSFLEKLNGLAPPDLHFRSAAIMLSWKEVTVPLGRTYILPFAIIPPTTNCTETPLLMQGACVGTGWAFEHFTLDPTPMTPFWEWGQRVTPMGLGYYQRRGQKSLSSSSKLTLLRIFWVWCTAWPPYEKWERTFLLVNNNPQIIRGYREVPPKGDDDKAKSSRLCFGSVPASLLLKVRVGALLSALWGFRWGFLQQPPQPE